MDDIIKTVIDRGLRYFLNNDKQRYIFSKQTFSQINSVKLLYSLKSIFELLIKKAVDSADKDYVWLIYKSETI